LDLDLAKAVLSLIGGLLGLLGGVLASVNGRLAEAKRASARQRVWTRTSQVMSVALFIVGAATVMIFPRWGSLLAVPCYIVASAIQVILFVRSAAPVDRWEIIAFSLLCVIFTISTMMAVVFVWMDTASRIVDLLGKLIKP
jgi:hypothetical protein